LLEFGLARHPPSPLSGLGGAGKKAEILQNEKIPIFFPGMVFLTKICRNSFTLSVVWKKNSKKRMRLQCIICSTQMIVSYFCKP